MTETVRATARVVALLAVLAGIAWISGRPFVFPSLGPSAYALAVRPGAETNRPHRVVGGHAIGLAAGLVGYHLFASGTILTSQPAPPSAAGLGLAASAVVAVGLTTAGMLASDLRHAPACATTLIVALGLLTGPIEAVIVVAAVVGLLALDRLLAAVYSPSNGSSTS
ncbi:HPP family protein [Halosegnis sp.]|uniref:HPP family protein n=1 Tax=Halosegnis sp. TaxID=2864959 RepID=UPI0035D4A26F